MRGLLPLLRGFEILFFPFLFSSLAASMEVDVGEVHIPLCIVDVDGKEWDLNSRGVMRNQKRSLEVSLVRLFLKKEMKVGKKVVLLNSMNFGAFW